MSKKLKNIILMAMTATVVSAGTVSAQQLYRPYQTTCRGFCTRKSGGCPNILGCGCVFNNPSANTGVCNFIAAKPAQ